MTPLVFFRLCSFILNDKAIKIKYTSCPIWYSDSQDICGVSKEKLGLNDFSCDE